MLMRRFLSMKDYSQQGFEASHKDQRQLWLKASSHDCKGESTSIEQMLVHFYAEKILFLRYCFQEALRVIQGKPGQDNFNFHFRGCGWKLKTVTWDEGERVWIKVLNHLMTMMFGKDHYEYHYNEKKVCLVIQDSPLKFKYDREQWNEEYASMISEGATTELDAPVMTELTKDDKNTRTQKQDDVSSKKRKLHVQEEDFKVKRKRGIHSSEQLGFAVAELEKEDGNESGAKRLDVNDRGANSAVVNQDSQNRVIASFPPPPSQSRITVLQMDLDTVDDRKELNDAIIDFFILFTSYHAPDRDAIDKCHFFSSFFYTKLAERVKKGNSFVLPSAEERHARACRFTRRVDIFKKELLFVPVCRSGHWFLLLIFNLPLLEAKKTNHHPQSFIFVMDSIAWSNGSAPSPREQEAEIIRSFLTCEWIAKKGSLLDIDDNSLPLVYPKVPQQENGYDCGVFVLLFFEEFLKQKFPVKQLLSGEMLLWYDQSSALKLRTKIRQILLQLQRSGKKE